MKRQSIQRIIILAIIAITGIIATQLYWINNALDIQHQELVQQQKRDSLNAEEFNNRVKDALTSVAQEILTINNDPAELYKAVEQLRPNYFVVRINDTLHPYLLEQLLKREFDKSNIEEDYRYGIYDCFTDSVVYSNTIVSGGDSLIDESLEDLPQIRWNTDGHYFSVTFPNKNNIDDISVKSGINAWLIIAFATIVSVGFIAYALLVIVRQKRLSEIKTDFINNMTHELKTPISTISLSSEVLLRPDTAKYPDRIARYAKIIFDENARLKNQVERVLQIAKLDRGEVKLERENINLHNIISSSVEGFRLQLEQKGGSITTHLHAESPVIHADEIHITNIVFNLLDNANKYTPENPIISIRTRNIKNGIELEVSDNGIGMTRENQKLVFDKFYRVPSGNIHDVKGFGLGLYYVKELVNRHGGDVSVQSTPGAGSTFTVWLPQTKSNE